MKRIKAVLLLLLSSVMVFGQSTSVVPSLDNLSGQWMEVNTLRSFPTVMNFVGGVQASQNLTASKLLGLNARGGER
ncbi:hypothetical protein [Pedobacter nyackensis]|uniref:Lipocalin-like domain-containing protein n=1 Tax=Pedobacter nyackensis TaxID=475255 RepID=A0A1W2DXE2_9SPHI|nr:hypothetical protein [Pedobacter nyackensis]SMD01967.1 hypothetical protein SAMN04488101_108235 [Pedobacter nyackensis]